MVQHSNNATDWKTIELLPAAGNSSTKQSYSYLHTNTGNGLHYYRIRLNDHDGKQSFTAVKNIQLGTVTSAIRIVNNPVQNGSLQLQITGGEQVVSLYNAQGQAVFSKKLAAGTHKLDVSGYTKGIYWLHTSAQTEKIIIH